MKIDMTLLPADGLVLAAQAFESGNVPGKYERDDWRVNMSHRSCLSSLIGHATRLASGELQDPDSGLPTAAHVAARGLMLAQLMATGEGLADLHQVSTFVASDQPTVFTLRAKGDHNGRMSIDEFVKVFPISKNTLAKYREAGAPGFPHDDDGGIIPWHFINHLLSIASRLPAEQEMEAA